MINFPKIKQDISSIPSSDELIEYLEEYIYDIERYFETITQRELESIKFELQELIYEMIDREFISISEHILVDDFLAILGEFSHRAKLRSLTIEILPLLRPDMPLSKRLSAQLIYLQINDITSQYHRKFNQVIEILDSSYQKEPLRYSIDALLSYYTHAMEDFIRIDRGDLAHSFSVMFLCDNMEYEILRDNQIISELSKAKALFKFQKYQEDEFLKHRGEEYEKFIGKEYESRDDLVIYNGLIRGNRDRGVDIISISKETKTIKIIQCKNWTKRLLGLEDITKIYQKLNSYSCDFYYIEIDRINSHLQSKKEPQYIEDMLKGIDSFEMIKIVHLTSTKSIDLNIKEIEQIAPNGFCYRDMQIVVWSYFEAL